MSTGMYRVSVCEAQALGTGLCEEIRGWSNRGKVAHLGTQ